MGSNNLGVGIKQIFMLLSFYVHIHLVEPQPSITSSTNETQAHSAPYRVCIGLQTPAYDTFASPAICTIL